MPFVTIREILLKVEDFHTEFGKRLQEAGEIAEGVAAKTMLEFLSDHQLALAALLSTMEKASDGTMTTLNEWVQFDTEVEDPRTFLQEFQVQADSKAEDILEQANKLDICLFCLYKGLAKGSSTPRAQRLFARLARMELDHQKARKTNPGYY